MQGNSFDHLVGDAYAVVAKPERLLKLLNDLQSPTATDEAVLQPHFANVIQLLNEIDPSGGSDFATYQLVAEENPSSKADLAITDRLQIIDFNANIFDDSKMELMQPLPDWMLGFDHAAITQLTNLMKGSDGAKSAIFRLHKSPDDEAGMLFAVGVSGKDKIIAEFHAMRLRWNDRSGAAFAATLELTQTEQKLAEHIVNGLTVREFADQRKRSLATARTQLKALLRKLAIGSQTDLISLYAGFHSAYLTSQFVENVADSTIQSRRLPLPDGSDLPYEIYGAPEGAPVLYLHATVDGAYLSQRQLDAVNGQGLRVIAPWLPFYAGSSMNNHGLDAVDEFVDRLIFLLDSLKIKSCVVVTARVSAPYGLAAVQRDPERFCGLVMAGGVLPADDANDFSHLALGYRAPLRLAKIAPSFVRLYFAATAAMVRRGQGAAFFESIYGDSAADIEALHRLDVVQLMKRSMQRTFEDGYEATAQQAVLTASDWSRYCHDIDAPVKMICGKEDGLAPPKMAEKFCRLYGFTLLGPLENVGSLAIHQVPEMVFGEARKIAKS